MIIETLEAIGILISIGSSLKELKNKFSNSKRRKEIAEWTYDLGSIVEDIAIHLNKNEYPHQTCARMAYVADIFSEVMGDAITAEEEIFLKELLQSAINIERTFGEYSSLEELDKTSYVQELYSISGSILGIADSLKHKK
jgi:hypothetical protein